MGFLSDAGMFINGGSKSRSESNAQSGFALLPPQLQKAFTDYAGQLTNTYAGGAATSAFTPLAQTQYETNALNTIGQGITPTAQSLQSDIAMQMNPFNDYVIGGINREAQGQNSILNQSLNAAGQLGSNRGLLGANDIENSRQTAIGGLLQNQYNTALDNSLNTLTGLRQQDVSNNFLAGDFLRGLDTQTNQAGINALGSYGGMLGAIPQSGGSVSNSLSTASEQKGNGGTIAALAALFSDERLKENIKLVDHHNGFGIYDFNYKADPEKRRYRGVMAQEVQALFPEAVVTDRETGFLKVHYDKIGVTMAEVPQ